MMKTAATPPRDGPAEAGVDVTRSNFVDMLPAMRQALKECTFFTFDLGGWWGA